MGCPSRRSNVLLDFSKEFLRCVRRRDLLRAVLRQATQSYVSCYRHQDTLRHMASYKHQAVLLIQVCKNIKLRKIHILLRANTQASPRYLLCYQKSGGVLPCVGPGAGWVPIMPKVKVVFKETKKASFLVRVLCQGPSLSLR